MVGIHPYVRFKFCAGDFAYNKITVEICLVVRQPPIFRIRSSRMSGTGAGKSRFANVASGLDSFKEGIILPFLSALGLGLVDG